MKQLHLHLCPPPTTPHLGPLDTLPTGLSANQVNFRSACCRANQSSTLKPTQTPPHHHFQTHWEGWSKKKNLYQSLTYSVIHFIIQFVHYVPMTTEIVSRCFRAHRILYPQKIDFHRKRENKSQGNFQWKEPPIISIPSLPTPTHEGTDQRVKWWPVAQLFMLGTSIWIN